MREPNADEIRGRALRLLGELRDEDRANVLLGTENAWKMLERDRRSEASDAVFVARELEARERRVKEVLADLRKLDPEDRARLLRMAREFVPAKAGERG